MQISILWDIVFYFGVYMDVRDFKAGSYKKGFEYQYFLPQKINHSFIWTDEGINDLLEKSAVTIKLMIVLRWSVYR